MRIAFFSDNFHPELGGIQDSIELMARELTSRGHAIDIYAPRYAVPDYRRVGLKQHEIDLGDGVSIYRLPSISCPSPTEQSRLGLPSLALIFRMKRPDIVHVHNYFGVGLTGLAAAKYFGVPVVGTNHTAIRAFAPYIPLNIESVVTYVVWFFNRCDLVTAPSRSVFNEIGPQRLRKTPITVSNAVDIRNFSPAAHTTRVGLRKKFGLSKQTIIYAGRFGREKNIDVIIRAVALLKRDYPSICLALAGHGSDERRLKNLVEELDLVPNVRFFGTIEKSELAKLFLASDLAVTMSTSETQSLSTLQAMASGLPVIGANARALPEFVPSETGFLVEEGDFVALSKYAAWLLCDSVLRRKLGDNSRKFAEKFSADRIASQWEQCYTQLSCQRPLNSKFKSPT